MDDFNKKIQLIINSYLSVSSTDKIRVEFKDIFYPEKSKNDKVGVYKFIKMKDGNPSWSITIAGTRYPDDFNISEIEEYDYSTEEYNSYRRDELLNNHLLEKIEQL